MGITGHGLLNLFLFLGKSSLINSILTAFKNEYIYKSNVGVN